MPATLEDLLSEATIAVAPRNVAASTVSPGGVDPLRLRTQLAHQKAMVAAMKTPAM